MKTVQERRIDLMEQLTLRAIRVNRGLSLEQASTLIGVSKDTLSNYERGDTYPDVQVLKRIEDVYNVTILNDTVNFLLNNTVLNGKEEKGV